MVRILKYLIILKIRKMGFMLMWVLIIQFKEIILCFYTLNGWEGINIDISDFSIKLFNHLRPRDSNLNLAISNKEGNVEMFYQKKLSQLSTIKKEHANKSFQEISKQKKLIQKL